MNNSSLGLVKQAQARYYSNRFYQSDMINPDFVQIAQAYGIRGVSINSSEELEKALDKYISVDFPVLFDKEVFKSVKIIFFSSSLLSLCSTSLTIFDSTLNCSISLLFTPS